MKYQYEKSMFHGGIELTSHTGEYATITPLDIHFLQGIDTYIYVYTLNTRVRYPCNY